MSCCEKPGYDFRPEWMRQGLVIPTPAQIAREQMLYDQRNKPQINHHPRRQ